MICSICVILLSSWATDITNWNTLSVSLMTFSVLGKPPWTPSTRKVGAFKLHPSGMERYARTKSRDIEGHLKLCIIHHTYRVTHHLDSYIQLTSKQKFPRLVGRYCSYLLPTQALSTFNLMSTEYKNQGAVSPCTHFLLQPMRYKGIESVWLVHFIGSYMLRSWNK